MFVSVSVSVFEFVFEGGERERGACRVGAILGAENLAGLCFPHALRSRKPEHRQPRATLEHELEHAHAHASPLALVRPFARLFP